MKTLGVDTDTPTAALGIHKPSAYRVDTWPCTLRACRRCHGVRHTPTATLGVYRPSAYGGATPRAALGI
jgi:hypothetical protein